MQKIEINESDFEEVKAVKEETSKVKGADDF